MVGYELRKSKVLIMEYILAYLDMIYLEMVFDDTYQVRVNLRPLHSTCSLAFLSIVMLKKS